MPAVGSRLSRAYLPLLAVALSTLVACTTDQAPTEPSAGAPALARSAVAAYTFVDLGTLDACCSRATGINDRGQVVGSSEVPFRDDGGPGEDRGTHPFLWENGVMTDLDVGDFSGASAISNAGTVVVSSGRFDFGAAFVWRDGVLTQLKGLGGPLDAAYAIGPNGSVVGFSVPDPSFATIHAVVWDKSGALTDLGTPPGVARSEARDINAAGQVVGNGDHALLWSRGSVVDLGTLGGNFSFATGINSRGTIVGCSRLAGDTITHAFIWKDGVLSDLGTLGGQDSCANDIDDAGRVVGSADPATGVGHAVIWDHGVVTDLGLLAGAGGSTAIAINARGTVVGTFQPVPGVGAEHAAMWIRR